MHLVWVLRQKQKQIHIWSLYFSAKWDFINGAFSFASTQNKWPKGGGKFFFKSDEQPFTPRWCWKRRRSFCPSQIQSRSEEAKKKTKKAVLKDIHSHKRKMHISPTFWWPKTLWLWRQPKCPPRKNAPRRNKLDHYAIFKIPLPTESAMKKTEGKDTLVLTVDVKANKHQVTQAVKKLWHWCGQSQHRHKAWWKEDGGYLVGSGLWCSLQMLPTKLGSSKLSPAG